LKKLVPTSRDNERARAAVAAGTPSTTCAVDSSALLSHQDTPHLASIRAHGAQRLERSPDVRDALQCVQTGGRFEARGCTCEERDATTRLHCHRAAGPRRGMPGSRRDNRRSHAQHRTCSLHYILNMYRSHHPAGRSHHQNSQAT
jgi:hypothetical protein